MRPADLNPAFRRSGDLIASDALLLNGTLRWSNDQE